MYQKAMYFHRFLLGGITYLSYSTATYSFASDSNIHNNHNQILHDNNNKSYHSFWSLTGNSNNSNNSIDNNNEKNKPQPNKKKDGDKSDKKKGENDNEEDLKKPVGWLITQSNDKNKYKYSVDRIIRGFEEQGFEMYWVNSSEIDVYLTNYERKSLLLNDRITEKPDFALSRTGASTTFATLAVFRHLERLGVPLVNGSESIETAKDKLYSLQILAQNNIPVPKTILIRLPVNVSYVIRRLKLPIIIKAISGMQGKAVFLARTESELKIYCDLLESINPSAPMIFQECLENSLGRDIRVLVVGGKVVGAMLRTNESDFRANIHRGGFGKEFKLPSNAEYIALQATKLLGLDIAGVDLLFDDSQGKKFRVCEINSSPGIEGFEKATNIDVTKHIVNLIRFKCGIAPDDEEEEELLRQQQQKQQQQQALQQTSQQTPQQTSSSSSSQQQQKK